MPVREDMQSLTQGIAAAAEARRASIASLREASRAQRTRLQGARTAVAQAEVARKRRTRGWLNDLARSRRAGAQDQRRARAASRKQVKDETGRWMQELARSRQAAAAELHASLSASREDLARAEAQRNTDVRRFLSDLTRDRKQGTDALVRRFLSDLTRDRKQGTDALRHALRRSRQGLATTRERLAVTESGRQALVRGWLKELAEARQGAQAAWAELTARLRTLRSGVAPVVEPPAEAVTPEEATAKAEAASAAPVVESPMVAQATMEQPTLEPEAEDLEEEELTSEVGEMTEEFAALRDRVFARLADHPDGVRMVEIELQFGLNRFEAIRVLRSLMDDGKAQRRDRLYFPM